MLEQDGRLIGYVDVDSNRDEPPLWWCDVKVAPDVDARAVVAELVAWLEERAVEGRLRVLDLRRRRPGSSVPLTRSDSSRSGTRIGWRSISTMELASSLRGRREISVRTATADDQRSRLRRRDRGLAGHERPKRRDLRGVGALARRARLLRSLRSGSSPMAGEEFAGFSICRSDPGRPAGRATSTCWACGGPGGARVSVRRCCFARSMRFGKRGLTRGTLGVDASSVTGATRLYERAGMRVYRDTVFLERAVRE